MEQVIVTGEAVPTPTHRPMIGRRSSITAVRTYESRRKLQIVLQAANRTTCSFSLMKFSRFEQKPSVISQKVAHQQIAPLKHYKVVMMSNLGTKNLRKCLTHIL
jgi:hypothetical protein